MFKTAKRAVADVEPIIHNLPVTEGETYSLGEASLQRQGSRTDRHIFPWEIKRIQAAVCL